MRPLSLIHVGSLFLILLQDVLGEIRLEDNVYKDVVIGINPEVPEDPKLISSIKVFDLVASFSHFSKRRLLVLNQFPLVVVCGNRDLN